MKKRLRRADCFLGVHYDLHAQKNDDQTGRRVTPAMVENIVRKVRPDYLQCDCKGHPGFASWPSKFGPHVKRFVRDPLRVWRDVTARHGVGLYMHYSGLVDQDACTRNPSWAARNPNGKKDRRATSVFGPYVDRQMIPQLQELRERYGVDGAWVDGECWGAELDYSRPALRAFREGTGIRTVPRKPTDRHFRRFAEFHREAFRRYLRYYVDELHRFDPGFQIASNWAFSGHMPEKPTANVDWLSGDYMPTDSLNSARLEGRILASQGLPWDLMTWSFSTRGDVHCTKSVVQMQQEAAAVLALGGGFQAYFRQKRDCSIEDWTVDIMAEVARFCRARQAVCHKARAVPQIGLLLSTTAFYRHTPQLFRPGNSFVPLRGVLQALLDNQQCVDVVMEHSLAGRMESYPLVVVPEWDYLPPRFKSTLRAYVRGGGNLLLVGPAAARLFLRDLGVRLAGKPEEKAMFLEQDGRLGGFKSAIQSVRPGRAVEVVGRLYRGNDVDGPSIPAATVTRLGKGRIGAVWFNVGERYRNAQATVLRDFVGAAVRRLFPNPVVEVRGSRLVDVTLNRKDGQLLVNLVNTGGLHASTNVATFDELPVVGPLEVAVRVPRRPRRVTLHPGGRALPFVYRGGKLRCRLPALAIHAVLAVE